MRTYHKKLENSHICFFNGKLRTCGADFAIDSTPEQEYNCCLAPLPLPVSILSSDRSRLCSRFFFFLTLFSFVVAILDGSLLKKIYIANRSYTQRRSYTSHHLRCNKYEIKITGYSRTIKEDLERCYR